VPGQKEEEKDKETFVLLNRIFMGSEKGIGKGAQFLYVGDYDQYADEYDASGQL